MESSRNDHYLSLNHLYKSFGDVQAVNDISIQIQEGELVSFIGPSGCGKTTLLRVIGGFHQQDAGEITLDGERIDHLAPEKRPTGMVFQNYALFPHMSIYKNVEYGLNVQKVPKNERDERINRALKQVQLDGYGDRKPSELSGGQQQRVAIARCLVLEPKVLLLDEPLSNLDANLRMFMREEIRRLKEELDLTIIFVTHDQEEALSISDRVIVLSDGKIQQVDKPENIYRYPENEFVANFVGHANILNGEIKDTDGKRAFCSEDITFPVNSHEANSNEAMTAMIRPEQIEIVKDGSIKGKIVNEVYNGNYVRYIVEIGKTNLLVDVFNVDNMDIYERGDLISIKLPQNPHYIK